MPLGWSELSALAGIAPHLPITRKQCSQDPFGLPRVLSKHKGLKSFPMFPSFRL